MSEPGKFEKAITLFDAYNANDPHYETSGNERYPKELLYSKRMTEKLNAYLPSAAEHLRLAVHCQHIGRWEITRDSFPMDKKGYLQWRTTLALHHAAVAEHILLQCGYDKTLIEEVKFLLQKKQLHQHADTQALEDVICLVFIEFYLNDFALQHEDDKVVDILKKTLKKMSSRAIGEAVKIPVTEHVKELIQKAATP